MTTRLYEQGIMHARAQLAGEAWAIIPERLQAALNGELPHGGNAAGPGGNPLFGGRGMDVVDGVAVIQVKGMIFPEASLMMLLFGGTSLEVLQNELAAAVADDSVERILIEIDSPGGLVTGVSEAARAIRAADAQKPVTAWTNGHIASAAYWLASAAGRIVMADTAMAGSIGIVTAGQYQVNPDILGYRQIDITSSNATDKRPDLSTEEGRAVVRDRLDAIEALFIDAVAEFRGVTRDHVLAAFGQGRMFAAADAVARGMADAISDFDPLLDELVEGGAGSTGSTAGASPFLETHAKEETPSMSKTEKKPADRAGQEPEVLSADDLMAQHPEAAQALYEQAFNAGTEQAAGATDEQRAEIQKAERERVTAIMGHADGMPGVEALVAEMIADGTPAADAAGKLLAEAKKAGGEVIAKMKAAEDDLPVMGVSASESGDPQDEDAAAPAEDDMSEDAMQRRWDAMSADERADFGDVGAFAAFYMADKAGRVRIAKGG